MTPARKAALQWFYDRGEVEVFETHPGHPTKLMVIMMICDDQLKYRKDGDKLIHSLTDKGRRLLNGDAK